MAPGQNLHALWPSLVLGLILILPGCAATLPEGGGGAAKGVPHQTAPFAFAVIGDVPYSAKEEEILRHLLHIFNRERLAFVVHVGDLKSGKARCDDEFYVNRLELFQESRHPVVIIPGDNDWTDCHRPSNGAYDPEERLNFLRRTLFASTGTLGREPMVVERQSGHSAHAEYAENVRWTVGSVMFVGLHVVGSNNNLGRTAQADLEFRRRNQANLAWMRDAFRVARREGARGLAMFVHGNPFNPDPDLHRSDGYDTFVTALEEEVRAFGRPVVVIHGDSHYFRIDKPLPRDVERSRLMELTRVEVFGSPDVHWLRGTVDPGRPNLFSFEPVMFWPRQR